MKSFIKKILPAPVIRLYHLGLAWLGAAWYRHPSKKMIVIGITGTSGKSTSSYFLRQMLEAMGEKVCALSTIEFSLPSETKLNDKKMTMLGRFFIQKYLRRGVSEGCTYAIVETTSEGVVQHRHRFIRYDVVALTNLYPEHIDSHGSFENYKNAKKSFFTYTSYLPIKKIDGEIVSRFCVVNAENAYAGEFADALSGLSVGFGLDIHPWKYTEADASLRGSSVQIKDGGLQFELRGEIYQTQLLGEHNVYNVLTAIGILEQLGFDAEVVRQAVSTIKQPPGRLERIDEGQDFTVVVDYAFEPVAMEKLYDATQDIDHKRIIHVFGSTGGGRDVSRRASVGEFVGAHADVCIVTDEDPYTDDPREIMDDVATAVRKTGKRDGEDLYIVEDRKEAIRKAVQMAVSGDLVLITGKGSEQGMMVGEKMIPWDDREIARKALQRK